MKDVFISYSRKDMNVANEICAALDRAEISYFIDRQDIGIGHPFANIAKAIKECTLFLYLGSHNAYVSKYAPKEVNYAVLHKSQNSILPYMIDKSPMPDELEFLLCDYNWRTKQEHPIEPILINDLLNLLGRKNRQPQIPNTSQVPLRFSVTLISTGPNKLQVMKGIKELLGTGFREAKDILDATPCDFPGDFSSSEANKIKQMLDSYGATISIQKISHHYTSNTRETYSIQLLSYKYGRLLAIKCVNDVLKLGLTNSANLVDSMPINTPTNYSYDEANKLIDNLKSVGVNCKLIVKNN